MASTSEFPETRHLRCFVAAAEAGSIRAAARRLGLAQPTVTEHVRKLEGLLGFAVFDRVGRSVVLTEEGRLLLPRAQRAVRAVEEVGEGIGDAVQSGVGRLAVGAIPTMSPFLLPQVVARLREEYPDCEVVVYEDLTETLLERLDDHSIEIAVLSPPAVEHSRIRCETIGSEPLLVVAPDTDGYESTSDLTLRELRSFPRISLSDIHCLGSQIESFCAQRDLTRQVRCHARQLDTVFGLVKAGLGVSLIPKMAAVMHGGGGLCFHPLSRGAPKRQIGIATKEGRGSSILADRFASLLELAVRDLCE